MEGHCPWLLISDGEHHEKQSFYSISEQKLHTTSIPQLRGKCVVDSAYGWLVLSDHKTNECCLWNPSSTEIIELPKLDYADVFIICTLSKAPTDPDCHVLFNSIGSIYQAFCRIGDDEYAINQALKNDIFLEASVSFQGEIYGIKRPDLEFVTVHFNLAEQTLELRPLMAEEEGEVWELDQESPYWVMATEYYLVKSMRGDEIFLVEKMSSGVFDQTAFRVFRVDFHLKKFVEIYNLGGETIFLSYNGGGWCCSSQGIEPNSIYYTVKDSGYIYIYDLNDQSTSLELPSPDASCELSKIYWVEPQVFRA